VNCGIVIIKDTPINFICIIVLFDEVSNMAIVQNFEVMLGQTLNHSVYNSVILCSAVCL
jgi:hypothetical protein